MPRGRGTVSKSGGRGVVRVEDEENEGSENENWGDEDWDEGDQCTNM